MRACVHCSQQSDSLHVHIWTGCNKLLLHPDKLWLDAVKRVFQHAIREQHSVKMVVFCRHCKCRLDGSSSLCIWQKVAIMTPRAVCSVITLPSSMETGLTQLQLQCSPCWKMRAFQPDRESDTFCPAPSWALTLIFRGRCTAIARMSQICQYQHSLRLIASSGMRTLHSQAEACT